MLLLYFAASSVFGIDLNSKLGLYFPKSDSFQPYQILSHMFMHGGFWHLFFNMYALYIFGQALENVWGPKRFFIFYFVCGLGAALVHETVIGFQYNQLVHSISPENMQIFLNNGTEFLDNGDYESLQGLYILLNTPTVGASGAIFGVLLAFGMLFPNTQLMLLFPPIPIKAKYFVLAYGGIELYLAFTQPGSNIAHAAHLGGMLFGFILIKYWQKTTKTLY
jgi:membrane associated rhomboid family serine protease